MKKLVAGLSLSWLAVIHVAAQAANLPLAAPDLRVKAFEGSAPDAFSPLSNAASLSSLRYFSAGMYGERRFLMRELSTYTLAAAVPSTSGCFSAGVDYFGHASFNQTFLHLAYARKLTSSLHAGIRFNYAVIKQGPYGVFNALGVDAAVLLQINNNCSVGMQAENMLATGMQAESGSALPPAFTAGAGYRFSEKLCWSAILRKQQEKPLDFISGLTLLADRKVSIMAGLGTATASFYLGASFQWEEIVLNISASIHPVLGITPGLLILYNAPGREP